MPHPTQAPAILAATLLLSAAPTLANPGTPRGFTPPVPGTTQKAAIDEFEAYEQHRVVAVLVPDTETLEAVRRIAPDQWTHGDQPGPHDFAVAPEAWADFLALGLEHQVVIEDLGALVAAERARLANVVPWTNAPGGDEPEAAGGGAGAGIGGGDFFDDYRPLDQLVAFADGWLADHADLVTRDVIGTSIEGRDIHVLTITGTAGPAVKPALSINVMQHAREWIGPAAGHYAIDRILDAYGTDPDVTALLDAMTIHFIPVTNPDGYVYSWGPERLWRKNRRDNGDGSFGVDLNRNWSVGWGLDSGSSGVPNNIVYRGPSPFSEPETQALRDFILAHPQIACNLDVHSYGQLILWPYGFEFAEAPEPYGTVHADHGHDMADALADFAGTEFDPQPGYDLYLASGVCPDWVHDTTGAFGYTYELRPSGAGGGGFILPPDQIIPSGEELYDAFLTAMSFVTEGVRFGYPDGRPDIVASDGTTSITVGAAIISSGDLDPSSALIRYSVDGGAEQTAPLADLGGENFLATFPSVPCGSEIAYRFEVTAISGVAFSDPPAGEPAFVAQALERAITFEDDFEDAGFWQVINEPIEGGIWERGAPAGLGDRGDPTEDFDGSGACYLTENAPGNTDVDGGPTRLVSPRLDATTLDDPVLSFAAWMTCDDGDDFLEVLLSDDDGATWVPVDSLGDGSGWRSRTVRLLDHITLTNVVRVRFDVADEPNDSVTEAGIDAVMLFQDGCFGGEPTPDLDGDGDVDFDDLLLMLGAWGDCDDDCPEDLDGSGAVDFGDLLALLAAWS